LNEDYFDNIALFEYHDEPLAKSSTFESKVPDNIIHSRFNIIREQVDRLLKTKKIRYPFLMKPELGVRGEGIVLINNENDLNKFEGNYRSFAIEQFIKSKYDWRVFVLGGVPLGVMKKLGNEDDPADFVAKSGGKKHFIEPDEKIHEEVCRIAVKACEVSGLDYAGID